MDNNKNKQVKAEQTKQPEKTIAELQKEIRLDNRRRFLRGQRV